MRNAERALAMLRERGSRGLPVNRVYRLLFNPDLYLTAYGRLSSNEGALTPGVTSETADGMSLRVIESLISDLRAERYRWRPVRRTYIPKRDGRRRPLGIPTWRDKLVQEAVRLILEAYYEPQFSEHSHGFRPGRGCHTALQQVKTCWSGVTWFVEGDISGCFDAIDHGVLLAILGRKVQDGRFLRLVENLLKAGYLDDWVYHRTHSGTPQGGVVSPILSNIYLNELDRYVEDDLMPAHTRGRARTHNREYYRVKEHVKRLHARGQTDEALEGQRYLRTLPKSDPRDPAFRRLRYVRYADDFLLGFTGPKVEAEAVKASVASFLRDRLRLELSEQKTLVTHAATERARFLGYEIGKMQCDHRLTRITSGPQKGKKRRAVNGVIALYVPRAVVRERVRRFMEGGKVRGRGMLSQESDYSIVAKYQGELRGLVQYYLLAQNVSSLHEVKGAMLTSMLKTLARKHKSTRVKMAKKYRATHAGLTCYEASVPREGKRPLVARFGGFPIRHKRRVVALKDTAEEPTRYYKERTELLRRLLADTCEVCGKAGDCEVHHVRKLADLRYRDGRPKTDPWTRRMAELRRKTLVVCRSCHGQIHAGKPAGRSHVSI